MAGGTALIQAVAGGVGLVGSKIAFSAKDASERKEENRQLRDELMQANFDSAAKQKVIEHLNARITELKNALIEEEEKTNKNEETIQLLKEQLEDLYTTLRVAESA